MSYTYALLQVSDAAFDEIERLLKEAGYDHCIEQSKQYGGRQIIDMHGIALERKPK